MKDYFSKEAVGSALILGVVIVAIVIVRDNLPAGSFKFVA
jgi:hypothetical protein